LNYLVENNFHAERQDRQSSIATQPATPIDLSINNTIENRPDNLETAYLETSNDTLNLVTHNLSIDEDLPVATVLTIDSNENLRCAKKKSKLKTI
jgi:hypothetical protein